MAKKKTKSIVGFERQHAVVQDQITRMEPAKQAVVREMQDKVSACIEEENEFIFSDSAFESDRRCKNARDLEVKSIVGKIFTHDGNILIKTPFETVIPAQVYVDVLQDRVIGVTDELTKVKQEVYDLSSKLGLYHSLTFLGLIKLAFKRLFGRNN